MERVWGGIESKWLNTTEFKHSQHVMSLQSRSISKEVETAGLPIRANWCNHTLMVSLDAFRSPLISNGHGWDILSQHSAAKMKATRMNLLARTVCDER